MTIFLNLSWPCQSVFFIRVPIFFWWVSWILMIMKLSTIVIIYSRALQKFIWKSATIFNMEVHDTYFSIYSSWANCVLEICPSYPSHIAHSYKINTLWPLLTSNVLWPPTYTIWFQNSVLWHPIMKNEMWLYCSSWCNLQTSLASHIKLACKRFLSLASQNNLSDQL